MTIKEFNDWVDTINNTINGDETVEFIVKPDYGIIYAFSILGTPKRGTAKCRDEDTFDERIGKAIAYAKLRGISIPTVDESKFERVKYDSKYYFLSQCTDGSIVYYSRTEKNTLFDNYYCENGNYFCNVERATEVADKVNLLLKLEHLHDIYCPDYKPNYKETNPTRKYFVYYDNKKECWVTDWDYTVCRNMTHFPNCEIAEKVCKILNEQCDK